MAAATSLEKLCHQAIAKLANRNEANRKNLLLLPPHLLAEIVPLLSPVALELLQCEPDFNLTFSMKCAESQFVETKVAKRSFYDMMYKGCDLCSLNNAWKIKFSQRWPSGFNRRIDILLSPSEVELLNLHVEEATTDWRQRFWEAHLQECLNDAVAQASISHHQVNLSDMTLSKNLSEMAGFELIDSESESKAACMLKYSFSQFGKHARYLRLRGAICTKELCSLLDFCLDLQHLACSHIDTATQINHLCILLSKKKETLHVLEFRNCRFAENELLKISSSLTLDGKDHCQLRHLFVHSSRTLFRKSTHASVFILFLHACRALESLVLVDNQIDLLATSKLFSTISTGMLHLSLFHLRENELIGLSELQSQFLPQVSISMSLKALDIRSNYLRSHDIKEFVSLFHAMPLLELLNLSDNPIGDEGLAMLLPVLQVLQLSELSLSACDLSIKGACFLLDELTAMSKCHLRNLDISHNYFGSSMGAALAKFLRHGIAERVDVGDIGLGANGSLSLESALQDMPKLSHLILRKNRLGAAGAPLFGKLLAVPNSLRVVDFSSNLLDRQCLQSVANHLRLHGGMLDLVDLRNNLAKDPSIFSSIKQPEVLLSAVGALYDDDP